MPASTLDIRVTYSTIDRFRKTAKFKTLKGAQKFAQKYVGAHPEISLTFGYAVSDDGVGKVTVRGCKLQELFPEPAEDKAELSEGMRLRAAWDGDGTSTDDGFDGGY